MKLAASQWSKDRIRTSLLGDLQLRYRFKALNTDVCSKRELLLQDL